MRECGTCNMCCTATFVPEFSKEAGVQCKHCRNGNGCSIYEERPTSCRTFECLWLQGDLNIRPDESGFMLEKLPDVPVVIALLDEGRSIEPEMTEALSDYKDKGLAVICGKNALLPDGMTAKQAENYVIVAAKSLGVI